MMASVVDVTSAMATVPPLSPVEPSVSVVASTSLLAVTLRLLSLVKALSQFPVNAEISLSAAERVFEILDEKPDDVDSQDQVAWCCGRRRIPE